MRSALSLLLFPLLGSCAVPTLGVMPRYGLLDIDGTAGIHAAGGSGGADVQEAGLEQDELPQGRIDFKFGSPHVVALAQFPEFEGTGTLDVALDDGSTTIPVGADIESEIELDMIDVALVFDLVPGDTFELGVGLGAAYLDLSMAFEETASWSRVTTQEDGPIPLAAAVGSVCLGPFQLALFAGGVSYSVDEDEVTFVEGDAYARLKLFGGDELLRGSLVLGYRISDVDLDYADGSSQVDVDLRLQGPYAGLEIFL
jgi:hypothetical protein